MQRRIVFAVIGLAVLLVGVAIGAAGRDALRAMVPGVLAALPLAPLNNLGSTPQASRPAAEVATKIGDCGESPDTWHPPVVNGCATGHEHGDAPPSWIADAGYQVRFTFHGNTSAAENTSKHAAMKGFLGHFNGQDIYLRVHAASNPLDRSARYHSYELWARDASGAVSHMQGWYDSGDPRPASEGGSRFARRKGVEPTERPIVLAIDETSLEQGITCEQWYTAPGMTPWTPEFGWTICGGTTMYRPDENATAKDASTWVLHPDGDTGTTRRLELAWYADRTDLRGTFVTDQFGEQVNSCVEGKKVVKFGVEYSTVCLEQNISPMLQTMTQNDNSLQTMFPNEYVKVPN